MSIESPSPSHPTNDDAWQHVELLVHEIARLSREDISPRKFYRELLERSIRAVAGMGGAIWSISEDDKICCEMAIEWEMLNLSEPNQVEKHSAEFADHARLLRSVIQAGLPSVTLPRGDAPDRHEALNPTGHVLLFCPLKEENRIVGLMEVLQRPDVSPATRDGNIELLGALCELADDFYRNQKLRSLTERAEYWSRFEAFVAAVHHQPDLNATAIAITNEGRRLVECGRLSVVLRTGSRCRMLAVSGVDTIHRRSNVVRVAEKLCRETLREGMPIWYEMPTNISPGSDQMSQALAEFEQHAECRSLAVLPLNVAPASQTDRYEAALILEWFTPQEFHPAHQQRGRELARQAASALKQSLNVETMPLLPLMRGLQTAGRATGFQTLPRLLVLVVILAGCVFGLITVETDFTVEGQAELQPATQRDIFAPGDGIVSRLNIPENIRIQEQTTLARIYDPTLEFETNKVAGELRTASQRLEGVSAARLTAAQQRDQSPVRLNQLAAEEAELKSLAESLQKQYDMLTERADQLSVRAPITGTILTWDAKHLLKDRPVSRGQRLLTMADLTGKWEVRMRVPDDQIGHVVQAAEKSGEALPVTFVLATNPDEVHQGEVAKIATATETDDVGGATVLVTIRFDRKSVSELRPGSSVLPRIRCGRRSLGYVWFHDFINYFEKHWRH